MRQGRAVVFLGTRKPAAEPSMVVASDPNDCPTPLLKSRSCLWSLSKFVSIFIHPTGIYQAPSMDHDRLSQWYWLENSRLT